MRKYLIVLISIAIMMSAVACQDLDRTTEATSPTKVIVDSRGREVVVPLEIKRLGSLGVLRLLTYMQAGDLVVAGTDMDNEILLARPYTYANPQYANLPVIGQGGAGGIVPFEEEIIGLEVDLVFVSSDYEDCDGLSEKIKIPVVAIDNPDLFAKEMEKSINIIGQILNKEDRAEAINRFMANAQADLNERTKDINDNERPSVYNGAMNYKGFHGFDGTAAKYPPFEAINANNVADGTGQNGAFIVDLEQVMVWDPEIIFLNPDNMDLVNEQFKKNPDYFNGLKAVKNNRVYSQLAYNNNYTNIEIALADAYYAGTIIYPGAFEDLDVEKKADDIFEFLLGKPLYSDFVRAGQGFGKLRIGNK